MSGPWEKYAATQKPWERYGGSAQSEVSVPDVDTSPDPEAFLNPYTGQYTKRSILKDQIENGLKRTESVPMMAAHGATLGTSDEAAWLAGLLHGGITKPKHGTAKDVAKFEQEKQRAFVDASREKYPYSSTAAEIGGGLVVPGSIMAGGAKAQTTMGTVGRAMGAGGLTGGLYAMGETDGSFSDRVKSVPVGAGLGAGGALVGIPAGKLAAWAGATLGKRVGRIFSDKRLYTEAGGLTQAGREAIEAAGYSADDVSEAFARQFSKSVDDALPLDQAGRAAEMAEFGIPAYKHNITGNPVDAADFERARRGGAGASAAQRVGDAATEQFNAGRQAVDDVATRIGGGTRGDQVDAAMVVTDRLRGIAGAEKTAAKAAYDAADAAGMAIDPQVASGITQRIQTRLADEEVDLTADIFKNARSYMSRLSRRGEGDKPVSLRLVDTLRKDLNKTLSKNLDPEDARALQIIKSEYDAWVDDVVEAKLFTGGEDGLAELKKARGLWADYAKKFRGKDAGSKFIQKMIDQDASPDDVAKWLFGSSRLEASRMNANIADTLKATLGEGTPEWNMLRQAAFRQLTQKPGTEAVTDAAGVIPWGPQKVSENLFKFLDAPSTRPLANTLFTKAERAEMRRLAMALKRTVPPEGSVNYSNTAYEGSRMLQKAWETLAGSLGFAQGGVAGAVAGREGAKALSGAKSWLAGRSLTRGAPVPRGIGLPASAAIGANQIRTGSFQGQQE